MATAVVSNTCLPTWMPCTSSPVEGDESQSFCSKLKGRASTTCKMLPALFLLATSIMGIVCAFIFKSPWLAIPFAAATITSTVLVYQLKEMKSFAESNERFKAENDRLKVQVGELETQLGTLRTTISDLEKTKLEIAEEKDKFAEQNLRLETQVGDFAAETKKFKDQTASLETQIASQKQQNEEINQRFQASVQTIKEQKEEAEAQVAQLKQIGGALGLLQGAFSTDETTFKQHLGLFSNQLKGFGVVGAKNTELGVQLKTNVDALVDIAQKLDASKQIQTLTDLHKKLLDVEKSITQAETRAQIANEELKKRAEELQKTQATVDGILAKITLQVGQFGTQNAELTKLTQAVQAYKDALTDLPTHSKPGTAVKSH